MSRNQRPAFFGYVKVELLSRSSRRWRWRVCKEGSDFVVLASEPIFANAEDAWSVGRKALTMLERGEHVEGLRAVPEDA
ncbi:hypothetical protein [Paracraurococcus lichenis]|uniref:DUF1508 domain-containing protein n=1 Tax=Paracraurococcus lichenis TaxID=3064888 RepID=A0ABT9EDY7_9PROT|nr:hypothetical protein [Paracraurococcus sp. LOR1-02]MDO9714296.1 hypothetical protein [Paracraurococcus sp. LOR1-02]